MDTILQTLRNLGPARLAIMGGVAMLMIVFFIWVTARLATPQLALLYSGLDPKDSSRIVTELEKQNIPFSLKNNGTEIRVPDEKVARLRLSMAEQGIPSGGSIGYEIFDKSDSISATNFSQNVNLVRALEGELSRTIRTIKNVATARVHLVLPQRQLFSRQRQDPSASIILQMRGSSRLDQEQISAVQHLIAAAVPGLTPKRISVVDDKGSLLAAGFEDADIPSAASANIEKRRRLIEGHMARTVEELLERTVGFGKVRAEVTAVMDFDRISTNEEKFDPEGQVVRSTQTLEHSTSAQESEANNAVTVAGTLPDSQVGAGESASNKSADARTEETVNFEISKKVINHVRESGIINRLSVAVLVDGNYKRNQEDEMIYSPRTKEEMEQLAALVRTAVGYNPDRGDSVEVVNLKFAAVEAPPEPPIQLFFGFEKNDMLRIAEILVLSIVAVLVILLVVRPLVTRAFESLPAAASALSESAMLAQQAMSPALTGPERGAPGEENFEDMIDLERIEGRVKASSVKKVGEIVTKHPEEALSIIRNWLYQET